jgi:hypothetical protein
MLLRIIWVWIAASVIGCGDVNSVTGDLISFGQVYECTMTIGIEAPSDVRLESQSSPCLADEGAEGVYEQTWIDTVCAPYLTKGPGKSMPGKGDCYIDCHLKDDGFDVCSL